jgi:exonuclease III
VAVTQKTYNGVAILSRHPIETISTALAGDEADSHARYLETRIMGIRVVNIYLPNGNPVGSDKFVYKPDTTQPWLHGCFPVATSRGGRTIHLLGLLSAGFRA